MEEVHQLAMAYYSNMSDKQQKKVTKFFKELDKNGDGMVSMQEFRDFLKKKRHKIDVPAALFQMVDKNREGRLDFWECVTLYYMLEVRGCKWCDGCDGYLLGTHFVCVKCYEDSSSSGYDLCFACYRSKNYKHKHDFFLDNYALLNRKQNDQYSDDEQKDEFSDELLTEVGKQVGSAMVSSAAAGSGCSIM